MVSRKFTSKTVKPKTSVALARESLRGKPYFKNNVPS